MKILGISDGHNSSAALMIDGRIVAAAQKERFSRLKNDIGYPKPAIDYCLQEAEIAASDLDYVAVSTKRKTMWWCGVRSEADLSVDDHVREQKDFYKRRIIDGEPLEKVMPEYLDQLVARKGLPQSYYDFSSIQWLDLLDPETVHRIRLRTIVDHLGVDEKKIIFVDHHTCHAFHALLSSPFRDGEPTLVITLDSSGDRGINATVRVATREGVRLIHEGTNFQFGSIYKYITLLLGMRPQDHEYKVMGLAPYADEKELAKSYPVFDEIQQVNGLDFVWGNRPKDLYYHFRERLEGHRFDGIAGAVQRKTETLVRTWLENILEVTGAHRVVFGGGVAMNIKLSMALMGLPQITDFFVGPSPADESNSIGACYAALYDLCTRERRPYLDVALPLESAYLGPRFDAEAFCALVQSRYPTAFTVRRGVTDAEIASLLQRGAIVARCTGRMEFGARALGNRSILANPSIPGVVKEINRQIKHRDFWMPFACSLLAEYADDYLYNEKHIDSDYMTLGFATRAKAHRELSAAIHPEDCSARPQIVRKDQNPDYHNFLTEFRNASGIGGVLNTSLNLHGHPIVNTPEDLLLVLERSNLEYVYTGDMLVQRNARHER